MMSVSSKRKLATILILSMNLLLFFRYQDVESNREHYLFIAIAIFSNAFYFFYISLILNSQFPRREYDKLLQVIIDDMGYAEPHHVEVLVEETKEDEAVVEILKPKEVVHEKPIYDKPIETSKYCDDLSQYMKDNGLAADRNQIREMFACMAASKLVVLRNDDPMISERFTELFFEFIGANFFIDGIKDETRKFEDLFTKDYHFKDCIKTSHREKDIINLFALKDVDLENIEQYFDKIIDYVLNPTQPWEIKDFFHGFQMHGQLPDNIWFMIITKDTAQSFSTEKLVQSAVVLELDAKVVKPKQTVNENALKLSYEHITNLLSEGYDQYFLEEEDWKKFDQIEEYFSEHSSFELDNRLFRQLERYASTFLMFGGDNKQAIDSVLFSKFLRLIHIIELNRNEETKEDVLLLFEKLFGLEYLTKSKRLLKEIQAANG